MGVEAGPSGAGAMAVAGPSISIVNEGPVARSALENTMPHTIGEISFNEKPIITTKLFQASLITQAQPELNALDVLSEAESILASNRPNLSPAIDPVPVDFAQTAPLFKEAVVEEAFTQPEPILVVEYSGLNLAPRVGRQPNPILGFANFAAPAESSGTKQQSEVRLAPFVQEVEEVIEEKRLVREDTKDEVKRAEDDEEIIQSKRVFLVDQPVLTQVLVEAEQAVEKGEKEAERLGLGKKIIGSIVAQFMPEQHTGNTGGAVKPFGVDGTIAARKEAIKAKGEFAFRREVEAIVLDNRPVTIGENGERASQQEVRTTFREHTVKPYKPREIFEKRVIRRQILAEKLGQRPVLQEVKPQVPEGTIEDNPDLAEVFGG